MKMSNGVEGGPIRLKVLGPVIGNTYIVQTAENGPGECDSECGRSDDDERRLHEEISALSVLWRTQSQAFLTAGLSLMKALRVSVVHGATEAPSKHQRD